MVTRKRFVFAGVAIVFGAGFMLGSTTQGIQDAQAQSAGRVFELRTYTAPEGKLPNLQALAFLRRHGRQRLLGIGHTEELAHQGQVLAQLGICRNEPLRDSSARGAGIVLFGDPEVAPQEIEVPHERDFLAM